MKQETLKAWIDATRPRTLPASAAPVVAATAYAWYDGVPVWGAAILCLLFAILAQIASNMGNDYFDYKKGGDTDQRVGPQRAVVSGLISPRAMLIATLAPGPLCMAPLTLLCWQQPVAWGWAWYITEGGNSFP